MADLDGVNLLQFVDAMIVCDPSDLSDPPAPATIEHRLVDVHSREPAIPYKFSGSTLLS